MQLLQADAPASIEVSATTLGSSRPESVGVANTVNVEGAGVNLPGLHAAHEMRALHDDALEARPLGHASQEADAEELAVVPAGHGVQPEAPRTAAAVPGAHP